MKSKILALGLICFFIAGFVFAQKEESKKRTSIKLNESDMVDEVRVIIKSSTGLTAYFTCSTQMKPVLRHFRIFGPKNAIIVDEDAQILLKIAGEKYKSYLNNFIPPVCYIKQNFGNIFYNIRKFLFNDFFTSKTLLFAHFCCHFFSILSGL